MKTITLKVNEKEFWLIREVMRKASDSLQDDMIRAASFKSPFCIPDIVDIHALAKRLDRVRWPFGIVAIEPQSEVLQFAEHLGLLLTEDQKETLETWERGGYMRGVRLAANTPDAEAAVRGLQAVMDEFLKEKDRVGACVLSNRKPNRKLKGRSASSKKI